MTPESAESMRFKIPLISFRSDQIDGQGECWRSSRLYCRRNSITSARSRVPSLRSAVDGQELQRITGKVQQLKFTSLTYFLAALICLASLIIFKGPSGSTA